MAGGADGSIIIDTELDNSGFKHGTKQLENAINSFLKMANGVGDKLSGSTQQVVSNLRAVGQQTQEIRQSMSQIPVADGFEKSLNNVQRQAASLQTQLQRMGDSAALGFKTDNQVIRFQTQVQHAQERLQALQSVMNDLGGQSIDTAEFARLTSEIGKAEQALFKLYDRRDIMAELGTDQASVGWQRLAIQIRNAEEELARLEKDRDKMVADGSASVMGVDVTQYQALQATLQQMTESLARYQEIAAGFNVIQQPAQESTEALENVDNELQQKSTDANRAKISLSGFGHALASISGFAFQAIGGLGRLSFNALTNGAKAAGSAVKSLGTSIPRWRGRVSQPAQGQQDGAYGA